MDYGIMDARTCAGYRLIREEQATAQAVEAGAMVPGRFPKRSLIGG